jgi:peptidoglycan/LPS O-acetylase OafA/YrhL
LLVSYFPSQSAQVASGGHEQVVFAEEVGYGQRKDMAVRTSLADRRRAQNGQSRDMTSSDSTVDPPRQASADPAEVTAGPMTGPGTTKVRFRGLDGARGLAAVGVLVAHVADYYPSGNTTSTKIAALIGASLIFFFVLSGFLLFLPYLQALTGESAKMPNLKYYAAQRLARVLPVYVVILLIANYVLRVAYVANPMSYRRASGGGTGMITDPWQLLANLTLLQSYIPKYFQTGLNPSWSLSMEYAFYAALPVVAASIFAMRKRWSMRPYTLAVLAIAMLFVMGFAGKLLAPMFIHDYLEASPWALNWGPNGGAVYLRSFPVNADNYALGMLAAVLIVAMERGELSERISRRVRLYCILAVPPTAALFVILLATKTQFETTVLSFLGALLILIVVAPLTRSQPSSLANWLDAAPLRFLGRVSLSLCLWHFPIMLLLGRWGLMETGSVLATIRNILVVFVLSALVSSVSYHYVERPAMNAARRYGNRRR